VRLAKRSVGGTTNPHRLSVELLKYTLALGWEAWPWFSSGGTKPG